LDRYFKARRLACVIALAAGLALLIAPTAFAGFATPESGGSPNANRISDLYDVALVIALIVFVGVEGALLYSLVKFRARRGAVAAQIRGNTQLEIGWTVGAAAILVVLAVLTFTQLNSIRTPDNSDPGGYQLASSGVLYATTDKQLPPNGRSLNIQVNGQQYLWRYTYPGGSGTGLGAPYACPPTRR